MTFKKKQPKIGDQEIATRSFDSKRMVYEYRPDPTLNDDDLSYYKSIDFTPCRWILVDVLGN